MQVICENCNTKNTISDSTRTYTCDGTQYYTKTCKCCGWEALATKNRIVKPRKKN